MSSSHINSPLYGSREEIFTEDCKEQYLFLLEFFVKHASGRRLAKLNQMFFVPTSVHFEFFDFVDEDDLQVTPVDPLFQPQAGIANNIEVFNTGKSVMFTVDHDTVMDRTTKLILKIIVKKQMPDGIKPDILVGTGELDLSGQYAALRIEMLQCWKKGITVSKEFEGKIPLNFNENLVGNLNIFARISCFGQTIVTEFDAPTSHSTSFIFSAGDIDQTLMYKCREVNSRTIDILGDSSEDLLKCPTCVPEKYPCIPCGKIAAVEGGARKTGSKECNSTQEKKLKCMPSKSLIGTNLSPQPCGKPVVLKVSGLFDNADGIFGKKPTVTVADGSTAAKLGDSSDPDHDIFVLRIGKKGLVGVGEKSDIQLEMKTPKGPERRPPIRYETRDIQTEAEEQPAMDKKKKKKKKK